MIKRKIVYALLLILCIWLAFATRLHARWFLPVITKYGGDIIWAGQFLFFLRILFTKVKLIKLACVNYSLGVLVEISQLYHAPWIDSIRATTIGEALLGLGFLWSDIICYAVGTVLAFIICLFVDKIGTSKHSKK